MLHRSLLEVQGRHDCLRTRFCFNDRVPTQLIDAEPKVDLQQIACTGKVLKDRVQDARRRIEDFLECPVSLSVDPPLRVRWIELTPTDFIVAFVLHHILTDWTSEIIFFRELWSTYVNLSRGRPSSLPEPSQYTDYVRFQNATEAKWRSTHEAYWREKLLQANPIQFPFDPRTQNSQRQMGTLAMSFGKSLTTSAYEAARRQRITVPMMILAIYVAALARLSGQLDIVIPFMVTGRTRPCDEEAMGFFAHNLYLRFSLTGQESLGELTKLVTIEFFASLEHLDYGRISMQRPELSYSGGLNVVPWSEAAATGRYTPASWNNDHDFPTMKPFPFQLSEPDEAPTTLALEIRTARPEISGKLWYRATQFLPETIKSFVQDMRVILQTLTQNPDKLLSTINTRYKWLRNEHEL